MAYYDTLIAAWNSSIQPPPGITGTALSSGMTTDQKLVAIMDWKTTGPAVPMVVPTYMIYNLIVPSDFTAASSTNQQLVRDILSMGTVDGSPGTSIRSRITSIFTSSTQTFTNLSNLAKNYDTPQVSWLLLHGYPRAISGQDALDAGLS